MDLPSPREIELETLVRQRDGQIAELTDEVTHLRQYLSSQPGPNTSDSLSLPPALVTLLVPYINDRRGASSTSGSTSSTVTVALTQRVKVLQEENDELYELLKSSETGRLKDDVRALRRVVQKLEGALRESHLTITSLSSELEKSHALAMAQHRPNHYNVHASSQSPAPHHGQLPSQPVNATNGQKKQPPTGPRAHKKPRISETPMPPRPAPLPPSMSKIHSRPQSSSSRRNDSRERERSPRPTPGRKPWNTKMEIDEDPRPRPRSPRSPPDHSREKQRDRDPRDRERERERESERMDRDKERDRARGDRDRPKDREREKDHDRNSKRDRDRLHGARRYGNSAIGSNGGGPGGGGSSSRRGPPGGHPSAYGGDRTLAERMGL